MKARKAQRRGEAVDVTFATSLSHSVTYRIETYANGSRGLFQITGERGRFAEDPRDWAVWAWIPVDDYCALAILRDLGIETRADQRREALFAKLMANFDERSTWERVAGRSHLFAVTPLKKRGKPAPRFGYFAVVEGDGLGVVDRKVYRAIVAEATAAGLSTEHLHVYAARCIYSGANLHIYQPGVDS